MELLAEVRRRIEQPALRRGGIDERQRSDESPLGRVVPRGVRFRPRLRDPTVLRNPEDDQPWRAGFLCLRDDRDETQKQTERPMTPRRRSAFLTCAFIIVDAALTNPTVAASSLTTRRP
ncbi:MAG: hypothetical protein P8Y29_08415 [Gemmatimonadota bacterium]